MARQDSIRPVIGTASIRVTIIHVLAGVLTLGLTPARGDTFLLKSVDGGRTWSDIDPGPPYYRLVFFQSAGPKLIAVAAGYPKPEQRHFLVVSRDSGSTWQQRLQLPYSVSGIAIDPADPETIFLSRAGTEPAILKVTGAGQNMVEYAAAGLPPNTRLANATVSSLYAIADQDELQECVFSCPSPPPKTIWRSSDGGHQWSLVTQSAPAGKLIVVPTEPETLYILSMPLVFPWEFPPGRLYRSTDGGLTWSAKLEDVGEVAIDPADPSKLFAVRIRLLAWMPEIWKSNDAGETWALWSYLGESVVPAPRMNLMVHPRNPAILTGQTSCGRPVRSEDGGRSWTWSPVSFAKSAELEFADCGDPWYDVVADSADDRILYAWSRAREPAFINGQRILIRSQVNGAPTLAPGSLIRITSERQDGAQTFELAGRAVYFGGKPAALLSVSPDQVLAQAPFGIMEGPIRIEIRPSSPGDGQMEGQIARQTAAIHSSVPAIFRALHATSGREVTSGEPGRAGEELILSCIGLGELQPAIDAGTAAPDPPPRALTPVTVLFSAFGAPPAQAASLPVISATAAAGETGMYHVRIRVPETTLPGRYFLALLPAIHDAALESWSVVQVEIK